MDRSERAKQFAPFDALRGLREALEEKEREHERREKRMRTEEETEADGARYAYPLAPVCAQITSKTEDMDLWVYTTWYRLRWPWLTDRVAAAEILSDGGLRAEMGKNMASLGVPDAGERIYKTLMGLLR